MTKRFIYFVSLLLHLKKIRIVMVLTTVLLLSGSFQLFAASSQPDEKAGSIKNDDQQRTVAGRITDEKGQALPGVNIVEKGTTNGAISDADGRYTLNVASATSVLVFSFVGYSPLEVTVGSQTSISVSLTESAIGLDEIVVVGYGTQQRRAISGSVTNVTEKALMPVLPEPLLILFRAKLPD